MKRSVILSAFFIALCCACNDTATNNAATDTGAVSTDHTSTTLDKDTSRGSSTAIQNFDSVFALKASMGNLAEIAMGKVALRKGMSQRVKAFGSMMVTEHGAAQDKLKDITTAKNIILPVMLDQKEQKHVDELDQKDRDGFDKMYMAMMLDDHKEDISEFQKAIANCRDADLKNFAISTLPVLQKHLDSARSIAGK